MFSYSALISLLEGECMGAVTSHAELLSDVGKNFLGISFLTFGMHMLLYSYLFGNWLFWGG